MTCHGSGEIVAGGAPEVCPDCFGEGSIRRGGANLDWRLRAIERRYAATGDAETRADVLWLVTELRRSREALVRILSRCQDAPSDPVARDVIRDALDVLGTYERE